MGGLAGPGADGDSRNDEDGGGNGAGDDGDDGGTGDFCLSIKSFSMSLT